MGWSLERVNQAINLLALKSRIDFLKPDLPHQGGDVYPWKFNRALSYLRRPFLLRERDEKTEVLWGIRHLNTVSQYLVYLCLNGRLKAKSSEMKQVMSVVRNEQTKEFNNEVADLLEQNTTLIVRRRVKKIGKSKIQGEQGVLGDVDVLLIGKSGQGKTVLARYLLHLLGGNQYVITTKKKPTDWVGLPVYGTPFKYDECEEWLNKSLELMYSNYQLLEKGLTPEFTNIAVDEWRSQQKNIDSAKETMKELISQARDAKVRILAIATGEQVGIWGLEGESDLEECFTTIRLGEFALEYAKRIKSPKSVLNWLEKQKRPCMVDRHPAEIPDLSSFQPSTQQVLLKPSFQPEKAAETISQSGLQLFENEENKVLSEAEMLLYKAFKAYQGSESDFIKQVWGASRYQVGKAELGALRAKAENKL